MARIKRKNWIGLIIIGVLFALVFTTFTAETAGAKSAFPSKTIIYIVPVSPGGGFDTFSRMIIPYLKKYLPGKPNIIIRNAPGGEWNIGITKMYRAKPDGHTIAILNMPANAVNQVLGTARLDLLPSMLQTLQDMPWVLPAYKPDGMEFVRKLLVKLDVAPPR